MRRSVTALAIAGAFASAAHAQSPSTVTLYGVVDAGILRIDPRAGTTSEAPSTTAIDSGVRSGSRWGLRGTEDLGGGLSAIMQLESGFSVDTGVSAQGGRLFGRQAYTGLSGGFGTVAMGRIAAFSSGTGAFDMYGDIDPFGTSYSNTGNLGNTQSSANSLRLDNAAVWRSPNWRGATLGAGYSFRTNGTENPGGSDANNAVTFLGASYGAGPVYLALTYDIMKLGEVAGDPKQKNLQIGGTYDLKFLKLHAAYAKEDNVHPTVVASTAQQAAGSDADAWMIGLSAPFGAHKLLGSYQKRNVDRFGATPEGDREIWAIAYEYRFTRRSVFYATYGDRKDEGSLRTATSGGQKALGAGFMHLF